MTAALTELTTGSDNVEIIRDQIAAILAAETSGQQALALAASPAQDPRLWALRVFIERTTPWEYFQDVHAPLDATPIVNVWFDSESVDLSSSNTVERQKITGTFNVDVYAYGVATAANADDYSVGHTPADLAAAEARDRAVRLCRRFLMSSAYTYLGLRGTVWRRMVQSITAFQPQIDSQPIQRVVAARLSLLVDFNELSPQYVAQPLEKVSISVKRKETGELYVSATYAADT